MSTAREKYALLLDDLRSAGSAAIAFSGGVDSTLLLKAAEEALGDRAAAVTITAPWVPVRELHEAEEFCKKEGIRHFLLRCDAEEIPGFRENPENRCYLCKKALFGKLLAFAEDSGFSAAAEGSNADDEGDYRPGLTAIAELGIKSPLRKARLGKAEIRELSKELGLPTWNKPSFACLASRFVYGEAITDEKLRMVDRAEQLLLELGFRQFRVRIHGTMARIEVLPADFPKLIEENTRIRVYASLKSFGFSYVSMDLRGFRSGSMNETLSGAHRCSASSSSPKI